MKSKYDDAEVTGKDGEIQKVLADQSSEAKDLSSRLDSTSHRLDQAIVDSEQLLRELKCPLPQMAQGPRTPVIVQETRPWANILADAETNIPNEVGLADLLTPGEIALTEQHIAMLREAFDLEHRLDGIDWAIGGVAGTIAALVDTFLVKMPSSPGLLGGQRASGGPLSDFIRGRVRSSCSPEEIRQLESLYKVPYDAAHSTGLPIEVPGLGPRTHRFQTLGHDPIIGFLVGTYDIMHGSMTAIDSAGHLVFQTVGAPEAGIGLFEALARQFGHLRSDGPTPGGLPIPLMPLLQFIQGGSFGKGERTVGEITRLMYAKGYDFGHFLAMSVPVLVIEVLVRISYCIKRLMEGHDLSESLPINLPGHPHQPKLQTILFVAHLISTAVNGGRAYLTSNPLAINYPQWIAFTKYSLQQLNWVLVEKEQERLAYVQTRIDVDWTSLNRSLSTWREPLGTAPPYPLS